MPSEPSKALEVLKNPALRDYLIKFTCPEFTCLCPRTGQPDFATLSIQYVPKRRIVELKSLKMYLWSFRNEGHFHEAVINLIGGELAQRLSPKYLKIEGNFFVRGGIGTVITVVFGRLHRGLASGL